MIAPIIKNELAGRIRRGVYPPGRKLPTRIDLTSEFNASRGTIDKVIAELRVEGYLSSSRGDGTYVLQDWAKEQRHIFMILPDNYYLDRSSSGPWTRFMDARCGEFPHTLCHRRDLADLREQICGTDARVIWVCPPGSSFPIIEELHALGVAQVLIARPHREVGYVNVDTLSGLREMLSWFCSRHGREIEIGMLLNCFDMELPYRIERELYFNQVANEMGLRVSRIIRAEDDRDSSLQEAVRQYFEEDVPVALFLPDVVLNKYVTMMARERGLALGRELVVISCAGRLAVSGGAAMGIPWHELYDEAIRWALSDEGGILRKLIRPEIRTDISLDETAPDSELRAMWDYIGDIIND